MDILVSEAAAKYLKQRGLSRHICQVAQLIGIKRHRRIGFKQHIDRAFPAEDSAIRGHGPEGGEELLQEFFGELVKIFDGHSAGTALLSESIKNFA
jgi:hypothetical protein